MRRFVTRPAIFADESAERECFDNCKPRDSDSGFKPFTD
jgi:hypothetical protein